jgi:hypothetical protein
MQDTVVSLQIGTLSDTYSYGQNFTPWPFLSLVEGAYRSDEGQKLLCYTFT